MVEPRALPETFTMTLREQIAEAFAHRRKPAQLVEARIPVTPEQRDALWFAGRHWRDIEWKDWSSHSDAFYSFVPEAFLFYLPSILIGAHDAPGKQLQPVDALIGVLDRSPEVYHWDAFITNRLLGLESSEYEALKAWILSRSGVLGSHDEDSLTRAYETVELLARETARLRNLLKAGPRLG